MEDILELCKTFREHSISTVTICQELSEEEKPRVKIEKPYLRSYGHQFRSNNWLKQHHKPMRRKPFKKGFLVLDELYTLLPTGTMRIYAINQMKLSRSFEL